MDFDLSEEQSILKDSLDRLLADNYGFEDRKKHAASPEGWSSQMWGRYAEMGLMALPFPEADGGLGGTPVETAIVMESLGRALALEPYFPTVVLGGSMLRFGGNDDQRAELIPAVAEGSLKLALAQGERHSRYDLHHVETTAKRDGSSYVLNGQKSVVLHGDSADKLFVTARTAGGPRDDGGIGVFLVDATAEGVSVRGYPTQDGARAAEVTLDNVRVGDDAVFGEAENGLPLIRRVVDAGIAALCSEAVGVMSAMHALTVDYLKVRKQFGVPIASFQVLQHAAVDMFVAIEQARSIALYATMMMRAARVAGERQGAGIDASTFAAMVSAAVEGVQERGKAQRGDKTLLDALIPAAEAATAAAEAGASLSDVAGRTAEAAEEGARATVAMKSRTGRASWFSDRTEGVQDPGATAVSFMLRSFADYVAAR